jgi:hypothetical protein
VTLADGRGTRLEVRAVVAVDPPREGLPMETDSSILISVLVMVGVITTIVYDVAMRRRAERCAVVPGRPAESPAPVRFLEAGATAVTPLWLAGRPAAVAPARPAPAPVADGGDAIRELFARLDGFRVLALDHVRVAHPLFRPDAVAADGTSAGESAVAWPPSPVPTLPGPRRRRHMGVVSARGTAVLRLVVDRA